MLESIRKYTGLMVVVLILLFVGLVFLTDTSSTGSLGGGPAVAKMEGREFTQRDVQHARFNLDLASLMNSVEMGGNIYNMARFGRASWVQQLAETGTYQDPVVEFMINRALLRKYAGELGIYPSREAVEAHIKTLPYFSGFAGEEKNFDAAKFERFKTKTLGRYSLTHEDFIELMEDELRFNELRRLIAGGVRLPAEIGSMISDQNSQIVDLEYTLVSRSKFEPTLEIAEEDIKAYWEENKEAYLTDEQRKVEYFTLAYQAEHALAPLPPQEKLPENASEEDKKAATEKRQAQVAEYNAKKEKRERLLFLVGEAILDRIIGEQEGKDFLGTAERGLELARETLDADLLEEDDLSIEEIDKLQIKSGTTELFTANELPAELGGALQNIDRNASRRTPADFIFSRPVDKEEADRVSNLLLRRNSSALAFKVTDTVAPVPLEYAKARSSARADLKSERLDELVDEAAGELVKKLEEGLAAEKTAAEIIKEAGYEAKSADGLDSETSSPGLPNAKGVFAEAATTDIGTVGEPVQQSPTVDDEGKSVSEGKVVFVVNDRRIADSPETDRQREQTRGQLEDVTSRLLFRQWLVSRQRDAAVEIIANIQN